MQQDRWARVITQWVPEDGSRCRRRPKKRWRDDLDAILRDWPEKAMQRKGWEDYGGDLCPAVGQNKKKLLQKLKRKYV